MSTATKNNTNSDFKSFERDQDAAIDLLERASVLSDAAKNLLHRFAYSLDVCDLPHPSARHLACAGLRLVKEIHSNFDAAQKLTEVDLSGVTNIVCGVEVLVREAARFDMSEATTCTFIWSATEVMELLTSDLEQTVLDVMSTVEAVKDARTKALKGTEAANDPKVNAA